MRLWTLLLVACATPDPAASDAPAEQVDDGNLVVDLAPPAQGYQLESAPVEVAAHSEVQLCSVLRLDPDGDESLAWVNQMESLSSTGTHHMNVVIGSFSFLDAFLEEGASARALGADLGTYDCADLPTMELGFPVFPSQRDNQQITLPEGVAAPLPLPLVAVFSHHYVNAGDTPITINAALNLTTVQPDEVVSVAGMVFDSIGDLEVEAGTRQSFARTCVVDRDVDVALVSTHTHEWATCASMNHYDGESEQVEDTPFYVNTQWDQPPILHFEPGTFSLKAGDGVHWACHYDNDTDRTLIDDGSAAGEMCVMAAVTWPTAFSVDWVEETVASRDLDSLLGLMDEVLGGCDRVRDDITGPWSPDPTSLGGDLPCEGLPQTESNTLE